MFSRLPLASLLCLAIFSSILAILDMYGVAAKAGNMTGICLFTEGPKAVNGTDIGFR